jgi:hypothetical protein
MSCFSTKCVRAALFAVAFVALWAGCGSITVQSDAPSDGGAERAGDAAPGERSGDAPVEHGGDAPAADGGNACTTSADCAPGSTCIEGSCGLKSNGAACDKGAECGSGFCADGVCCRVACQGACVSCSQAGRVGSCWPVDMGKPDPRGICVDQGATSCGTTGACDGFGACAPYAAGVVCASSRCVGNSFEGARVCDGAGKCGAAAPPRACAPYACNPANCLNACISDAGCAAPAVCIGGSCRTLPSILLTAAPATREIGGTYTDPSVEDECPAGAAVVGFDVAATPDPSVFVDRIRTICGTIVVTRGGSIAIEIGATTALTERGTGPGTAVALRCPQNQVVVGYDGRGGSWVDQLSFRCAPLVLANNDTVVVLGDVTPVGPVGGAGGSPQGVTDCGPATVAVGSRSLTNPFLMKLSLSCATVAVQTK